MGLFLSLPRPDDKFIAPLWHFSLSTANFSARGHVSWRDMSTAPWALVMESFFCVLALWIFAIILYWSCYGRDLPDVWGRRSGASPRWFILFSSFKGHPWRIVHFILGDSCKVWYNVKNMCLNYALFVMPLAESFFFRRTIVRSTFRTEGTVDWNGASCRCSWDENAIRERWWPQTFAVLENRKSKKEQPLMHSKSTS